MLIARLSGSDPQTEETEGAGPSELKLQSQVTLRRDLKVVSPMGEAEKLFTDGEAYERLMGRWSRIVGEGFLDWLSAPKNLRWIDVGCGNGAFTEELIARCAPAAVIAIDPSDDQLAYARTRPGLRMTDFRVGDAQNLPFAIAPSMLR